MCQEPLVTYLADIINISFENQFVEIKVDMLLHEILYKDMCLF
jgi:hypothetical protein